MNYLYTATCTLILVFIYLIFQKKKKNNADYLLIVLNLLIGSFLISDIWVRADLSSPAIIFQNAVPLFIFPVFVYYALQYIYAGKKVNPLWRLIFLPGFSFILYSCIDHFVIQSYDQEALIKHFNNPTLIYHLFFKGSQITFIIILFWLLTRIRQFRKEIKDGFSYIETISIGWLRNFTLIYLFILLFTFVLFLSQNLGLLKLNISQVFGALYGVLVFSTFYLNFQGIKHYTLDQEYTEEELLQEKKVKKISVNEQSKTDIHHNMIQLFEDSKVYLQPKFGLKDLSDLLDQNTHTVSAIINEVEEKSFYDLVNGYRVEHLKMLLKEPKNANFTILGLGLESGFNSKASLNRIFKNHTGLTPKQYLDNSPIRSGNT